MPGRSRGSCAKLRASGARRLHGEMVVSGRWWAESIWAEILEAMPPWVIAQLEIWKQLIEELGPLSRPARQCGPR